MVSPGRMALFDVALQLVLLFALASAALDLAFKLIIILWI
jgi:hypothetical protein